MEQTTTATTFRVIYTCRNRNCKNVWALEYVLQGNDFCGVPYGTRELKEGERVGQSDRHYGGRRSSTDDVMGDLRCPMCGCNLPKSNRVQGTYNSRKCNAKCQSSKSGVCSCSCGGENHGIAHL